MSKPKTLDLLKTLGKNEQYFSPDKVHMNRNGHETLTELIKQLLTKEYKNGNG